MHDRFPQYIERVLSHEGNLSMDPKDPGNWTGGRRGAGQLKGTKFGISAKAYPYLDIKNLTRGHAIEIYKRDFWDASGASKMHPAFAFQMLDAAVNHGIGNATRMLQTAVGVSPDGAIGPITRKAIAAADPTDLVLNFFGARLDFYAGLGDFDRYGRGWMRRFAANLRYAALDN